MFKEEKFQIKVCILSRHPVAPVARWMMGSVVVDCLLTHHRPRVVVNKKKKKKRREGGGGGEEEECQYMCCYLLGLVFL
jgi:hypothetical protein